jgi:adenine-specific DNA-methyltransferase
MQRTERWYKHLVPFAFRRVDSVTRAPAARAPHVVVCGENMDALPLLVAAHEGEIDCIYIDPPYNTGARDWKYNNAVDAWLPFMRARLELAKKLLKPDGVLVVTIDEHELFDLGVLLGRVFDGYLRYVVSVVINSRGSTGTRNFGVIDEHAIFVVPDVGRDLVLPRERFIKHLSPLARRGSDEDDDDDGYWTTAHRTGQGTSFRHQRPNQFYPIHLDAKTKQPIGVGAPLARGRAPVFEENVAWPIDEEGGERVWAWEPSRMAREIARGNVQTGRFNPRRKSWALRVRRVKQSEERFKERTVWWEKSYDAGANGTSMVKRLLGRSGAFPFPKSVYAVRDTLATIVGSRKDALVVDFFAGSGTTLHAVAMLNAIDGGARRAILVTNDENGICRAVTFPRVRAAITGVRPNGAPVPGRYKWQDDRAMSDGFDENVAMVELVAAKSAKEEREAVRWLADLRKVAEPRRAAR